MTPARPDRGELGLAELLAPSPSIGVPIPAYSGRSLPNVVASVVRAVGGAEGGDPPLAPPLAVDRDPFAGRRAEGPVLVLLADGLGWSAFDRWRRAGGRPWAARWGRRARPITTVFPTTTVPAMVTLSTGTTPAQHGVVGYREYLPRFGVVADLLRMSPVGVAPAETLVGSEWSPSLVSGAPTVFRRGMSGTAVSRGRFEGLGLTRLLYDGAAFRPYSTASDLAHELVKLLDAPDPSPVVYAYWDELDAVHHRHGPTDALFSFEADRLAHLVEYVADHLDRRRAASVQLIVTADHGLVDLDPARQLRVDRIPEIADEMARPLAGDRRAPYFAAHAGRLPELRAALERHLPVGTRLIDSDAAIAAGLYGPPPFHPELRARIGDLVALPPPPTGLLYAMPGSAISGHVEYLGGHGGLSSDELLVPLVAGRLDEFGARTEPAAPRGATVKKDSR
ncbi:MAG TPA: alkaline phosphatase family protein [Thermoplasmata archaeon]|nr:alkaline phosphatase family protein [Thermoplasmata archaeon]